jgi:hypothetical protein
MQGLLQSVLTQVLRRGVTLAGTAGVALSEDWYVQTAALLAAVVNEVVQWWLKRRAEKAAGLRTTARHYDES